MGKSAEKYAHMFSTEHLQGNLKNRAVRSGALTMTSQGLQFVLQLGSTMVLARLLVPEDFGLLAMVVALTNFAVLFKDLGLSLATIQKAEITQKQVSSLFWINVAFSFAITVIFAGAAPFISHFYNEPRLLEIALIFSATFLLSGLVVQHQALMRRQMRFTAMIVVQILSSVISIAAAIMMAWFWRGSDRAYMALVWMRVIQVGAYTAGIWVLCPWVPSPPARGAGVRSMLMYGADVTGFNIINYFSRNLDNVLIGKFCGPGPLGFYAKAYQIVLFPLANIRTPIVSVAMPVFSRLQDQPFLFRKYYSKLVFILAALSMPLMAYLYVCSSEVIRIVFGEKWLEMDAVFKVLTLAGFIQVVSGTPGVVLLSLGQSRRYLQAGILSTIFTIISFIIGIQYGAIGVAKSYTVMSYVTVPAVFLFAFRGLPVHFFDFLSGMWRVCVACVFGGAVVIAVTTNLPEMSLWVALFVKGVLGGCVMIITLLLLPGGSKQLMLIWKLVKMNIYNKD